MKFGQLIEYNRRKNFYEKSYTKSGEKTIPRPFSKIPNLAYLRMDSLEFYIVYFYCMSKSRAIEIY